jgi:hypothetical protein
LWGQNSFCVQWHCPVLVSVPIQSSSVPAQSTPNPDRPLLNPGLAKCPAQSSSESAQRQPDHCFLAQSWPSSAQSRSSPAKRQPRAVQATSVQSWSTRPRPDRFGTLFVKSSSAPVASRPSPSPVQVRSRQLLPSLGQAQLTPLLPSPGPVLSSPGPVQLSTGSVHAQSRPLLSTVACFRIFCDPRAGPGTQAHVLGFSARLETPGPRQETWVQPREAPDQTAGPWDSHRGTMNRPLRSRDRLRVPGFS